MTVCIIVVRRNTCPSHTAMVHCKCHCTLRAVLQSKQNQDRSESTVSLYPQPCSSYSIGLGLGLGFGLCNFAQVSEGALGSWPGQVAHSPSRARMSSWSLSTTLSSPRITWYCPAIFFLLFPRLLLVFLFLPSCYHYSFWDLFCDAVSTGGDIGL